MSNGDGTPETQERLVYLGNEETIDEYLNNINIQESQETAG